MTRDRPRVRITLALTLLALLVPVGATGAAARPPAVPFGFVGMSLSAPVFPSTDPQLDLSHQLDAMAAAGVETLRVDFNWSYMQPYKNWSEVQPGDAAGYTDVGGVPTLFGATDELVGLAAQHHMTVLPTVTYAPGWDLIGQSPTTFGRPRSVKPYARFLTALVQRYGPRGSFWEDSSPKVPIRMWQVWNEPNVNVFWPARPFQYSYVSLLRAAHTAIKRADPGAKVVLGGMPNYSWRSLESIYRIRGARRLFDVVALHPYTRAPQGVITILARVRSVMDHAGDARKPMISDEISWPSSLGKTPHTYGFDFATTEAGQARNTSAILPLLAQNRTRLGLMGFYYFTWAGVEQRNGDPFGFSGLFRVSENPPFTFTAKPAFGAFRKAALAIEGCSRKGHVATVCLKRS